MAKPIHKQITSVLGFFLFAILIASFAFFGAGSIVSQPGAVVATVGDQKITVTDFVNSFDNEIARYREQFGPEFDTQAALAIGLDQGVVNQLVQRASLDQQAEDLGLLGSTGEVRHLIREMDAFQDLNGNFSEFTYKQRLAIAGMNAEQFEDRIRLDIGRTQLIEAFADTALLPAALVEVLYAYRKESRRAEIATIPASAITNIEAPTPEALKAYYQASPNMFASPEYRNLSFLIVRPEDYAGDIELSEEELREEYQIKYEDFNIPEARGLEVAILRSEDQAGQLYQRVAAGEDFAAVAAELTGFTPEELSLGEKNHSEISNEYGNVAAERVFAAPLDGVTEPTQSINSWQVFHVTLITPGTEKSFEDSLDELRALVAADRGIDNLYNAVAVIDNDIISGFDIEQISTSSGNPLITLEAVSAQGGSRDGGLIAETKVLPYLARAFTLQEDDPIELYEAEDDIFYIIKVNGIIPPVPPPFEEVENQARQSWFAEEQLRLAGIYANQALAAAEGGTSLEEIAARYGGISFETDSYRRDRVFTQRELAPGIARLMFGLEEGGIGIEQDARGDGYLLIKVTEIKSQDPAQDQFEFQALVTRLQGEMQTDIFIQLQAAIQRNMDISINRSLIDNLYDPDRQVAFSPF